MKNILFISSAIFLLYSCSNPKGQQFLGTWKNKQHDSIAVKIKNDGGNFTVATFVNEKLRGTETYGLIDSALITHSGIIGQFGFDSAIHFVTSSGCLSWQGIIWEKIAE